MALIASAGEGPEGSGIRGLQRKERLMNDENIRSLQLCLMNGDKRRPVAAEYIITFACFEESRKFGYFCKYSQ